jgi:hypothetical protein
MACWSYSELEVTVQPHDAEQLAALEHLRRLPHLYYLSLLGPEGQAQEADFPPFIPPSLKILFIKIRPLAGLETLLRQLPSMLQASGASLEEFDIAVAETKFRVGGNIEKKLSAEGSVAFAQILRTCSSSLRTVRLSDCGLDFGACGFALVGALMSCSDTLEVLSCPWAVYSALPATCPTFPRLIKLCLRGARDEDIDWASPAWGVMASGRLPALATLQLLIHRDLQLHLVALEARGERLRLAPALEAVAGTLKRLIISVGMDWAGGVDVPVALWLV